jgi:thiol-disulfide isomerase/thioredoxin
MKKITFTMVLCIFTFILTVNSQTTILSEDFEGGSLPSGWSRTQASGSNGWLIGSNLGSTYFSVPSHTIYAMSNDDECNCDMSEDYLITPALDLTSYSAVTLNFQAYYIGSYGSIAHIEVSTDGGTIWTVIFTLSGVDDEWQAVSVNLGDYLSATNLLIGFHHDDNGEWASGFGIDDIAIIEPLAWEAELFSLNIPNYVETGNVDVKGTIKNNGANTITSIDVTWSIDGGTQYTDNLTGLSIAPTETYFFTHSDQIILSTSGTYSLEVTISNPNGNQDLDTTNNTKIQTINALENIAQKQVLVEHFTNASCGPCASYNPDILNLFNNNPGKVAHIAYHTSWPGTDPMYNFNNNNGLGDARVSYYGISGVPHIIVAGNQQDIHPADMSQSYIDNEYERPGLFEITGSLSVSSGELSIDINIKALTNFPTGTIKAHVVLVEHVTYTSAPGSNGETYFPDVMRNMFPNKNGTDIGNPSTGNIDTLTFNYTIPAEINISNCSVIVFVQNDIDKEVYMVKLMNIPTSIDDIYSSRNILQNFPNPGNDYTIIPLNNINKNYALQIIDATGHIVLNKIIKSQDTQVKINTSKFKNGMYFYRLIDKDKTIDAKPMQIIH